MKTHYDVLEMVNSIAESIAESAADFILDMIAENNPRTFDEVAAEFSRTYEANAEDFASMFLEEFRDNLHAALLKKQAKVTRCEFEEKGFVNGLYEVTDRPDPA